MLLEAERRQKQGVRFIEEDDGAVFGSKFQDHS